MQVCQTCAAPSLPLLSLCRTAWTRHSLAGSRAARVVYLLGEMRARVQRTHILFGSAAGGTAATADVRSALGHRIVYKHIIIVRGGVIRATVRFCGARCSHCTRATERESALARFGGNQMRSTECVCECVRLLRARVTLFASRFASPLPS